MPDCTARSCSVRIISSPVRSPTCARRGCGVAAERALQDAAVAGAVEDGAPALELADAVGGLLGVELGHAPVVEQLAADHRVAEVRLPGVLLGHVGQRRGDAALGHHGVRLAEQRLADQPDRRAGVGRLDRGAQAGAAGADDQDVVRVRLVRVAAGLTGGSPGPRSSRPRAAGRRGRRARPRRG